MKLLFHAYFTILFFLLTGQDCVAQIKVTADADTVGVNKVFELTIVHPADYPNNWEDVSVKVTFNGPVSITVNGFYFDQHTWKVRFACPQTGVWAYAINFVTPNNTYNATGTMQCTPSDAKGFLTRHPNNPFRLVYPDGSLFNGLGIEDCVLDYNGNGTPLDDWGFGGRLRSGDYTGSRTDMATYFAAYGKNGARFNLFRWTTDNCSFKLYDKITTEGNQYLVPEGKFGDTLVRTLQAEQMRIWLTLFGPPFYPDIDASTPLEEKALKRYVDYVVARYGAYVDIWELFNESSASSYYYNAVGGYLKAIDPYHRLLTVSDERPKIGVIDINSPHWYEKESELQSDARTWQMISKQKEYGKPVIFGEQGNSVQCWDPLSALRMRIRSWTSFFAEGILIYWNASWAMDYQHQVAANIYLGPEERKYIRALHDYSALADADVSIIPIKPENANQVRAYGLSSNKSLLVYFHHFATHDVKVNSSFKIRLKNAGTVYWTNPADNTLISSTKLPFGTQVITTPPFAVDMAMRIVFDPEPRVFDPQSKLDLIVYPNPASFQIAINGNFSGLAEVILYATDGSQVLRANHVKNDEPISVETLSSGIYVYGIKAGGKQVTGKIVISK